MNKKHQNDREILAYKLIKAQVSQSNEDLNEQLYKTN